MKQDLGTKLQLNKNFETLEQITEFMDSLEQIKRHRDENLLSHLLLIFDTLLAI